MTGPAIPPPAGPRLIRIKPGVLIEPKSVLCILHDPEEEEGTVTIGLTHGKSVTTKKQKLAYSLDELERAIIECRDPEAGK